MLVAPHVHVYQVTCPVCGEEYTVSEARAGTGYFPMSAPSGLADQR